MSSLLPCTAPTAAGGGLSTPQLPSDTVQPGWEPRGQAPARGQRDGHVWTSGWAPCTSFLEAQDGGHTVGMGHAGWIYSTQSKPRLCRGDGRRVGARAPPAQPARFACSVAAGGDKGALGNPAEGLLGAGAGLRIPPRPRGHMPRLRISAANCGQGSSGASQGGARPRAVGPRRAQPCGGADRGLALPALAGRRR